MFGSTKKEFAHLEAQLENLHQKMNAMKEGYEEQIKNLRQQVAALVLGYPPTASSILSGLGYSEIPKEHLLSFIQKTSNLLILDIRSDEGWANGHIPNAKHIPHHQVYPRLIELSDKNRPILTICPNGNTSVTICQMLVKEGYKFVFNALGGMAGYSGPLTKPLIDPLDEKSIQGDNRELIRKIIAILDRDVRPGLKRDGGDIQLLAVEGGVVKIKMVGACLGCGSQKRTVEHGIKVHLIKEIPEIKEVEDHS
ncbi:MAG: NifU family protein [Deltaproteobacteria bacterium]|nr:NifU family protein [Deltaproteobacteria bacterium]